MQTPQDKIRNFAIIAHVDHGKTTLVDAFLKQSHVFRDNQEEMNQQMILDTGDLEREKGITIKAKNISIDYNGYLFNIIDTPGHADFGGEVERTLNMADGCLLLVDAQEGPMPQTRFVFKKALELGLRPIVVINKIDKKAANITKTLSRIQDLFLTFATSDEQLEFPVFYAVARDGKVWTEMPTNLDEEADIKPLLETIVDYVPAPTGDASAPLQMQITTLDFDAHNGRYLIGKIKLGTVKLDDPVAVVLPGVAGNMVETRGRVRKIMIKQGLGYKEVESASAGQIAAILGVESKTIGATLCASEKLEPLPVLQISEPSVRIKIEPNTSPFLGQDGEFVTAKQLQQRLEKESDLNISLRIEKSDTGSFYVSGRGDLQLSILLEELRREGFELQVRRPEVIIKEENGKKFEPLEELFVEVPDEYSGNVLTGVSARKGELLNMESENGQTRLYFKILTANLLGLRNNLVTETKGNLVMNNSLLEYVPFTKTEEFFRRGALISSDTGVTSSYALNTIQERGELFVIPAEKVYEGMIIGINKYEEDMEVNPCKERQKSGVRRNQAEITHVALKAPKQLTLEFALFFLAKDEILEITPQNLRLRKQYLTKNDRIRAKRNNPSDLAIKQMQS